ncbi:MAG: arginine repressor [Bacteroidales bacterium]
MVKADRQQDIRKIIESQKISGQDELLGELGKIGYNITQATLSRDIKEMGIAKIPDPEKGYIYVLPKNIGIKDPQTVIKPGDSVLSVEFSYHFGVIKTLPGFASSIAIYIDSLGLKEIIGTLAGDDTVIMIPREPFTNDEIKIALHPFFPKVF